MVETGYVTCKRCGVRMTTRVKKTRLWVLYAFPETTDWQSVRLLCE